MEPTTISIPTLTTNRLIMRAPEIRDFDAYAEFRASERVKWQGGPNTRDESFNILCSLIGMWQLRGYGPWLVADKDTDTALGVVGLFYPEDWPEPEITWGVLEKGEGRGVAYEAAVETRRYAYEVLKLPTLVSLTIPQNERSKKLAKRLGAIHESDFNHPRIGTMNVWRHLPPNC